MNNGLTKTERLTSQLVIDKLFAGGNASMAAFPLRIVYMQMEKQEGSQQLDGVQQPPVSILVSVPKKRFRHAVDRNRMKRLVREAYRLNKHILWNALQEKNFRLAIAFVCITDTLPTFRSVNKSMRKALIRIGERVEG
ncbi:MAG: ribonuclease P protein component [Bacteroidaceae bacterium]|jgi:ribonuclease P protein component|nr:ribonuclease P protein component [Bacteroidaceae bacterium]MBR1492567.1 ribonuclease P protein component [Bacteroidaceae bacterium]